MPTRSWAEVDTLLSGRGEVDLSALRRTGLFRRLIEVLRTPDFPYSVYPDTDGETLSVFPTDLYNYSVPELLTVMSFVQPEGSHAGALARVRYEGWNARLNAREVRTWEMAADGLERRLRDLFDEVGWPR